MKETSINSRYPELGDLLSDSSSMDWDHTLQTIIKVFGCETGTLHFLDTPSGMLQLKSQFGIPPFLIPKLSTIPIGKGMAGIAAERKTPVEMCNLQTDASGIARPAAKETKVEGSIALPLLLEEKLYGTLGIAKSVPYDFTDIEKEDLLTIGELLAVKRTQEN